MKTPEAVEGFIQTLNKMGFMTERPDSTSLEFIDFACTSNEFVLEVGAAYGVTTLQALQRGCHVVANDIDERHLSALYHSATAEERMRLTLHCKRIPQEFDFPEHSLRAILACRVIHFFTPAEVGHFLEKSFASLRPGGKLFIVTETPYVKTLSEFIPEFEKRKSQNDRWPGMLDVASLDEKLLEFLPNKMLLFDVETLSSEIKRAGFKVEKCHFFSRPEFPEFLRYDGRESVACVAIKS